MYRSGRPSVSAQEILAEMDAMRPYAQSVASVLASETSRVRKLTEASRGNNSPAYDLRSLDAMIAETLEEEIARAKQSITSFGV